MTDPYVVQLELDAMPTPGLLQSLIEHLDDFQPAVSTSSAGLVSLTLTVPAADLRLAVATGLALARVAAPTLSVLTVSAMPERVRKARQGLDAGELLSASQAAEILGVTRQRVLQMIVEGKLPNQKVGRDYTLPRAAVEALRRA